MGGGEGHAKTLYPIETRLTREKYCRRRDAVERQRRETAYERERDLKY